MDDILGLLGQGIRQRGGLLGAFLPMSEAEREEQRRKQLQAQYLQEQMAQMQFTRQQAQAQAQAQLAAQQEAQRKAQEAAAQQARMTDAARDPYAMFRKSGPAPKWTVADALKAQMEAAAGDPAAIDKLSEAYKRISDVDQPEYGMTLTAGVGPDGKPAFFQPSKRGGAQVVRGAAPQQDEWEDFSPPGAPTGVMYQRHKRTGEVRSAGRPTPVPAATVTNVVGDSFKVPPGHMLADPANPRAGVTPIPGSPDALAAERRKASEEVKGNVVLGKVAQAREIVKKAAIPTTGFSGAILSKIPGTPGYDLGQIVTTIKANVGFNALNEMRAASPTGGALGNVTEKENQYLQATIASLEQAQSEEQFLRALDEVERAFNMVVHGTAFPSGGKPQGRRYVFNPKTGKLEPQ